MCTKPSQQFAFSFFPMSWFYPFRPLDVVQFVSIFLYVLLYLIQFDFRMYFCEHLVVKNIQLTDALYKTMC